jgi:hypothetical protein
MRKMHEHRDWTIGIAARQGSDGRWTALVEVYEPGRGSRTHAAKIVPFSRWLETEEEAEGFALRDAKQWIDQHGEAS